MFVKYQTVKVVENKSGSEWDFLVGKVGTIIDVDNNKIEVTFMNDEPWADMSYICTPDELEVILGHVEEG